MILDKNLCVLWFALFGWNQVRGDLGENMYWARRFQWHLVIWTWNFWNHPKFSPRLWVQVLWCIGLVGWWETNQTWPFKKKTAEGPCRDACLFTGLPKSCSFAVWRGLWRCVTFFTDSKPIVSLGSGVNPEIHEWFLGILGEPIAPNITWWISLVTPQSLTIIKSLFYSFNHIPAWLHGPGSNWVPWNASRAKLIAQPKSQTIKHPVSFWPKVTVIKAQWMDGDVSQIITTQCGTVGQ
jgi:hypothetical protein